MSRVSVRYMIDDVPAAMRFYTTLLGFTVERDASPAFASVVRDGVRLLLSGDGSSGKRPLPDGRQQVPGGWNRVHLEVSDLAAEVARLRAAGYQTADEPGQEDFGWYFGFRFQGEEYHLVIGSMEDTPYWLIWLERAKGLIPSLFGARNRGIKPAAVQLIHDVLGASPNVSDMRWWHKPDFDRGADESLSSPSPV